LLFFDKVNNPPGLLWPGTALFNHMQNGSGFETG